MMRKPWEYETFPGDQFEKTKITITQNRRFALHNGKNLRIITKMGLSDCVGEEEAAGKPKSKLTKRQQLQAIFAQ
jgi:hypothetical protein